MLDYSDQNATSAGPSGAAALNLSECMENIYSDDQKAYRVYANMPISIFGTLSNIVNIIVFCDAEMRTMLVNHFLLALSISDLILIICNFFFLVLPVMVVESDSFFWNNLFPVIIRYSYPLALTAQTCGVYLTVLVSVHRFLGVCTPFQAKRWVTRRPVQYAIVGSVAFSVLVNVPTWLELTLIPCYSQKFDAVSTMIALAPFHEWTYIFIKKTVVYTFVMFVIPFAILITVNWKIIMALKQSSNLRTMHTYSTKSMSDVTTDNIIKQFRLLKNTKYTELFQALTKMSHRPTTSTSPSAKTAANTKTEVGFRPSTDVFKSKFTNSLRDRSVTLMLLAIVALFLLCNGLAFCNSIVESVMLVSDSGDAEELDPYKAYLISLFEVSVEVSNVLITLNSSTSTLVYIVFSSKYRLVLKSMLGLAKRPRINRVAVTTAVAAQRAVELSLIPDEADSRQRRQERYSTVQLQGNGVNGTPNSISNFGYRRAKLFRSQTTLNRSLTNSESNMRLMEELDSSTEDKSTNGNSSSPTTPV